MFLSWIQNRCAERAGRLRRRPCVEALEDRFVLSTAGATAAALPPPQVNSLAAVAITAYAGQMFTGTVATFNSSDSSGLTSTIQWGDGHASAGAIAGAGGGTFAISGTNTFSQAGFYSLVVSINAGQDRLASVQVSATVRVPGEGSNVSFSSAGTTTLFPATPGISLTLSVQNAESADSSASGAMSAIGIPAVAQTTAQNQPAAVTVPLPQQNTPQTAPPIQVTVQVQVPGPTRVLVNDLFAWSSTRDQGLNRPMYGQSVPAWAAIAEQDAMDAAPAGQVIVATAINVESLVPGGFKASVPGVMVAVSTPASSSDSPASPRATVPEEEAHTADLRRDREIDERGQTNEDTYHQPLYRVADRRDLGGSPASYETGTVLASSIDRFSAAAAPFVPVDRSRGEEADLEWLSGTPAHVMSEAHAGGGVGGSMMEAAATWAVFHALHTPDLQPPPARPAVPGNQIGTSPEKRSRNE